MSNEESIDALNEIRTYCAANLLDALDYVIQVMKKLKEDGVENPLETDFTKLAK
ncbi:MAG: hypothetical protein K6E78_09785 [Treponema sp.]|nr:hypothetical protein [Treponema sp.]